MKNKVILKKKTLQEMEMKRMPRKLKKNYKKYIGIGEIFSNILENEDTDEVFKGADMYVQTLFCAMADMYRDNLQF